MTWEQAGKQLSPTVPALTSLSDEFMTLTQEIEVKQTLSSPKVFLVSGLFLFLFNFNHRNRKTARTGLSLEIPVTFNDCNEQRDLFLVCPSITLVASFYTAFHDPLLPRAGNKFRLTSAFPANW